MMKQTAILVCLLLTVVAPLALGGQTLDAPAATDPTCVSVNQDPTNPVDVGSCPAGEEVSNIP